MNQLHVLVKRNLTSLVCTCSQRKSHRFYLEILVSLMSSDVHNLVMTVSCDYTGRPTYPRVICFKAYHVHVKVRIIPDGIYNVI